MIMRVSGVWQITNKIMKSVQSIVRYIFFVKFIRYIKRMGEDMKAVLLAGGLGTRISMTTLKLKTSNRNHWQTNLVAYYEDVFFSWNQ